MDCLAEPAIGEADVDPAGEEALLIPDALPVAKQDQPISNALRGVS